MLSLLANGLTTTSTNISPAALIGLLAGSALIISIIAIAFYVYFALVWSSIAKKLGYKKHWLAWIPIANLFLVPILADKEWGYGFLFFIPILNVVLYFVWTWKIFEKRNYSGWWALIPILDIIPIVNFIAIIGYIIILGFVAWKDRA